MSSVPPPNASIARFSMRMPWSNGSRHTGSRPNRIRWMHASAARSRCRSPTSPRSIAIPSAAHSSNCAERKIRYTDRFDDPNLPGEMTVTVLLKTVSVGVEINITQEGIPDMIPPEACVLGWQESLQLLKLLVEAEIPG
ncbi:MAG: SRPBCC domain-containing protein [Gemmataceae bacterium]